jgi:hypothetical protein
MTTALARRIQELKHTMEIIRREVVAGCCGRDYKNAEGRAGRQRKGSYVNT